MKKLAVVLTLALSACNPPSPQQTDYVEGKPTLVVEHDGVRVWKVKDDSYGGASYVYFTTLGEAAYSVSCGKNCTRQVHTGPLSQ